MRRNSKKLITFILSLFLVLNITLFNVHAVENEGKVKNVIMLIPDGTSITHTTIARWYNGGAPLAMDEIACGLSRTYPSDAAISDSAPGATALAAGYKSHTGFISVLPDIADMPGLETIKEEDKRKPLATVLEGAKFLGKSTGIIATSNIQHATPAAFSSHYPDRNAYEILGEQQVYNNLDVVLGAGSKYLKSEIRQDKEDLITVLKEKGYDYVTTPEEMKKSIASKLWGMFDENEIAYEFDRDPKVHPSLSEMTTKAIDVLSKNEKGFFLMVEGSKVDWASHANDPIGVISEVLSFDKAVKVALDFAKSNKDTVIIVVADHGNGGMSIGDSSLDKGYDKEPLKSFIDPLKKAKNTAYAVEKMFNQDYSNVKKVMETYYGINDLTQDELKAIKEKKKNIIGHIISKRAHIGWTTGGHTGEEVALYIYHPQNIRLTGVVSNTDIAKYMAKVLGVNLEELNKNLFVSAKETFEGKGATVIWDDRDVNNPVVVVKKGNDTLKLPVYKNIAYLNDKIIEMKGLTIFNGIKTYVPQEAIDLIP